MKIKQKSTPSCFSPNSSILSDTDTSNLVVFVKCLFFQLCAYSCMFIYHNEISRLFGSNVPYIVSHMFCLESLNSSDIQIVIERKKKNFPPPPPPPPSCFHIYTHNLYCSFRVERMCYIAALIPLYKPFGRRARAHPLNN